MLGFQVDMNVGGTLFNSIQVTKPKASYSLAWGAAEPHSSASFTLLLHLTCEDKGLIPCLLWKQGPFWTPGLLLGQQLKQLIPPYWPLRRGSTQALCQPLGRPA